MKYSSSFLTALALSASGVAAFPAAMYEKRAEFENLKVALREFDGRLKGEKRAVGFNAATQYVPTTGANKFVPPTNVNTLTGDQRGPCPGLNAMANHNYIPHNGIATIDQFINGTYTVFGMGKDLGGFLAVYGALIDGNGAAWSIGGPSTQLAALPNIGLLSTPQGISGSHNKYEADVSPTRPDLYEYGNDYKVITSQFKQLYDMQPNAATANYDLSVLTPFRAARFQQSIDNNPYFFNGPFSGVAVQPAAYTFIYRFMSNKSAEYPEGRLNQAVLKSFFSITGDDSSGFTWKEGWERIPDNWYKRAIGDEYTIPFFLTDLIAAAAEYPQFIDIGGNTGKTNTFTGVDILNLTGGVYNANTLLQGNNAACFIFQFLEQAAPDLLKGLFVSDSTLLGQLNAAISSALGSYSCPALKQIDESQFNKFPGYTKSQ